MKNGQFQTNTKTWSRTKATWNGSCFLPKSSYTNFLLAPILPWIKSFTHISVSMSFGASKEPFSNQHKWMEKKIPLELWIENSMIQGIEQFEFKISFLAFNFQSFLP
jgi:hypothetical protein